MMIDFNDEQRNAVDLIRLKGFPTPNEIDATVWEPAKPKHPTIITSQPATLSWASSSKDRIITFPPYPKRDLLESRNADTETDHSLCHTNAHTPIHKTSSGIRIERTGLNAKTYT
jgi:hypothetical protein